jgi:glutathione reductase (NADPH)
MVLLSVSTVCGRSRMVTASSLRERLVKADSRYVLRTGRSGETVFDAVLNATGRIPNTDNLGLEKAGVTLTPKGTIPVSSYSAT